MLRFISETGLAHLDETEVIVSKLCLVCGPVSLGTRPRYSLVVDEDVKKPTNEPNKQMPTLKGGSASGCIQTSGSKCTKQHLKQRSELSKRDANNYVFLTHLCVTSLKLLRLVRKLQVYGIVEKCIILIIYFRWVEGFSLNYDCNLNFSCVQGKRLFCNATICSCGQ